MRNPDSRRCEAHHALSRIASKRIMASGTFLVNGPGDLAGICKAGNAPYVMHEGEGYNMQDPAQWIRNKNHKEINRAAVKAFQVKFLDRATKKILNLPPLERIAVNFDVNMPVDAAHRYNEVLQEARHLKARIERTQGGRGTAKDMTQLIAKFVHMQQCVISPTLAEHGAAAFDSKTAEGRALIEQAAREPTGAFHALRDELETLRRLGHKNIVIAANHTTIMEVAKKWIERDHPEFGACFEYKGEMNQKKRVEAKKGFLRSARSLMFLSIGAGGVGLHLVPKPEAIIFWGSMPFSPAHVEQAWNRIHRIGQHAPITGKVTVVHLVPHGSVDCAIGTVHGDKQALINLVQENDDTGFGGDSDSQWRKGCRIVDACLALDEGGSFGAMPQCKIDPLTRQPMPGTTYTVLPGVVTRGREPSAEESAQSGAGPSTDAEDDEIEAMFRAEGYSTRQAASSSATSGFAPSDFAASLEALRRAGVAI